MSLSSALAFRELFPASLSFDLCVQFPPTQMGLEEGDTPVHGSRKRFRGTFENEEEVYKVAYVRAKLATNFKELCFKSLVSRGHLPTRGMASAHQGLKGASHSPDSLQVSLEWGEGHPISLLL